MSHAHRVLSPHEYEATANGQCALAIMTKAPQAGKVKTRLTPPLTAEEAAELNICFLRDAATAIAGAGTGARGIGCYTPVGTEAAYDQLFPTDFQLIAQRGSDLSERLVFAVQDLLAVGFSSVCLIGSDSPTIPVSTFAEAVKVLSRPDDCVVLGPSDDGGYYLVGLKKIHRRIFEQISWSTKSVMEQTLERAAEIGLSVHLLPAGYDVDDRVSLCRLCHDLLDSNVRNAEIAAPATRKFLRELLAGGGRGQGWLAQARA